MITTINEFKKIYEYFEHSNGIIIYPSKKDKEAIGNKLDSSIYYAEWDEKDGYFFIEEEYIESFTSILRDLNQDILKGLEYTTDTRNVDDVNESNLADENYTHFALWKATDKIMNAWNYSDIDSEELNSDKNHYFMYDLKDFFPDENISPKTISIVNRKTLDRKGIDPEDTNNWFKHK